MLSDHDKLVIDAIFQQEIDLEQQHQQQQPLFSVAPPSESPFTQKQLELIKLFQTNQKQALNEINLLIEQHNHPALINDRAVMFSVMGEKTRALEDLNTVISSNDVGVRVKALEHRALLVMKSDSEASRRDLEEAAKLGSSEAKKMLKAMNPYAQLCAQAVNELLRFKNNSS